MEHERRVTVRVVGAPATQPPGDAGQARPARRRRRSLLDPPESEVAALVLGQDDIAVGASCWPEYDPIDDSDDHLARRPVLMMRVAAGVVGYEGEPMRPGRVAAATRYFLADNWVDLDEAEIRTAIRAAVVEGLLEVNPRGLLFRPREGIGRPDRAQRAALVEATEAAHDLAGMDPPGLSPTPAPTLEFPSFLFEAPRLRPSQVIALAHRVERGDRTAVKALVAANTRLVLSNTLPRARRATPGHDVADMFQAGITGLIRAAEKFDYRRGNQFSTYATLWIQQAMARARANEADTIRLPVHVVTKRNRVCAIARELWFDFQREPSPEEIGEEMALPSHEVEEIQALTHVAKTLDDDWRALDPSLCAYLVDAGPSPEEECEQVLEAEHLRWVLGHLSYREQRVLESHYGLWGSESKTLDEIGQMFNVTRERIRQIEITALGKLQGYYVEGRPIETLRKEAPREALRRVYERQTRPVAPLPLPPPAALVKRHHASGAIEHAAAAWSSGLPPTGREARALLAPACAQLASETMSAASLRALLAHLDDFGIGSFAASLLSEMSRSHVRALPADEWLTLAQWALASDHAETAVLVLQRLQRLDDATSVDRRTFLLAMIDAGSSAASPSLIRGALEEICGGGSVTQATDAVLIARALQHMAAAEGSAEDHNAASAAITRLDEAEVAMVAVMLAADVSRHDDRGYSSYQDALIVRTQALGVDLFGPDELPYG